MNKDISYKEACSKITILEEKIELLTTALKECKEWAEAYPIEVFPEPTPEQVDAVCKTLGFRLDRISAMVLRSYTGRIGEIAKKALGEPVL